jgi:hypothetical protein
VSEHRPYGLGLYSVRAATATTAESDTAGTAPLYDGQPRGMATLRRVLANPPMLTVRSRTVEYLLSQRFSVAHCILRHTARAAMHTPYTTAWHTLRCMNV